MKARDKANMLVINKLEGGRTVTKVELDPKSIVLHKNLMKATFKDVKKYRAVWVDKDVYQQLEKL
jgi:hypothetical protein